MNCQYCIKMSLCQSYNKNFDSLNEQKFIAEKLFICVLKDSRLKKLNENHSIIRAAHFFPLVVGFIHLS